MEPAEVEEGLKKAYNRLVQKANIPGFRKGKVPRPILEQYVGKAALLEDAVEHMVPEAFEKAAKEKDLKPIARPEVQVEKMEPVIYKMVVPLEPIVKVGDYHSIKLTPESIELKEEDINKAIEQLRHQHSIWEPVDRQVNARDMVILDIESNVGAQPYINQKDAEYRGNQRFGISDQRFFRRTNRPEKRRDQGVQTEFCGRLWPSGIGRERSFL